MNDKPAGAALLNCGEGDLQILGLAVEAEEGGGKGDARGDEGGMRGPLE